MQIHAFEKIISGRLQKKLITMVQSQGRSEEFRGLEGGRLAFHSFVLFQFLAMCVDCLSTKYFKQKHSKVNILKLVSKENAF